MKIATFNINNVNERLDNLMGWLAKAEPDVVSLQELKAEQRATKGHSVFCLLPSVVAWSAQSRDIRKYIAFTCGSSPEKYLT